MNDRSAIDPIVTPSGSARPCPRRQEMRRPDGMFVAQTPQFLGPALLLRADQVIE